MKTVRINKISAVMAFALACLSAVGGELSSSSMGLLMGRSIDIGGSGCEFINSSSGGSSTLEEEIISGKNRPETTTPTKAPDSTVVFKFKAGKETFWADLKDNRQEISNLDRFLHNHKNAILSGEKPVWINGYAESMPSEKENLALAKVRSNQVKSYMIMKYRFKEDFFRTKNHAQSAYGLNEIVTAAFVLPKSEMLHTTTVTNTNPEQINEQDGNPHAQESRNKSAELTPQAEIKAGDTTPAQTDQLVNVSSPTLLTNPASINTNTGQNFEDTRNYALLEKNAYYVSLYANFSDAGTYNMLIEPLFEVHKVYNRNVDVQAAYGHFVSNNVAVGVYGGYRMSDIRMDVSSDLLQLMINSRRYETNNISTGYNLGVFTKTFIPLEYSHRIFLVNEASLYYTQTRSLSRNVYDQGAMLSKVYQNTYAGGIKLSVGLMYFIANGFTIEFNISPVAAMYQYNTVINNERLNGKFAGGAINTILLPLDLKFGLNYFFGLDYKKNRKHINFIQNALLN